MNLITFIKYPIYFLPILLVTGPFLSDLAISITALLFLVYSYKEKINFYNHNFFIFFILFWIFISINSLFSGSLMSIKTSVFYIRFGIFLLLINYLLKSDINFSKNFKNIIFITITFVSFDALYQFIFGINLIGYVKDSRISSFFGDEKILGSFFIKIIPVYICLFFIGKKEVKPNFGIAAILFITIIIILLSGERSALGLFILYLFLLLIIFVENKKKLTLYFSIFICSLFLVILSSSKFQNRFLVELKSQFFQFDNNKKIEKIYFFTKAHHYLLNTSLNMFQKKPINGYGTKTFRENCNNSELKYKNHKYSCNTHPHNFYLQMAAENGLIGIFFLICLYLLLIKDFIINLKQNYYNKLLNLSVVSNLVILWPIIPHGNFFNNWLSILIYLNLSIYIFLKHKPNTINNK